MSAPPTPALFDLLLWEFFCPGLLLPTPVHEAITPKDAVFVISESLKVN